MLKVFHVPSHLAYAAALTGEHFRPVPSPTGAPLTVAQVVGLASWRFFDVLHLHTVELTTVDDLERLCRLARERDVRLVCTVHDLVPNIEADQLSHRKKLALIAQHADAMLTLTDVAAAELANGCRLGRAAVQVAPHGAALPLGLAAAATGTTGSRTVALYGALRPNRDVLAAVRAWRRLPATRRSRMRVLLRSVGPDDERRNAETLLALRSLAETEPALEVVVRPDFVPADELVRWLAPARALVLPYRQVTHSGQLELACDLGLPVLAPDVGTLRGQLEHNRAWAHPVVWYPTRDLAVPDRFAERLEELTRLPRLKEATRQAFLQRRRDERTDLLRLHQRIYEGAGS